MSIPPLSKYLNDLGKYKADIESDINFSDLREEYSNLVEELKTDLEKIAKKEREERAERARISERARIEALEAAKPRTETKANTYKTAAETAKTAAETAKTAAEAAKAAAEAATPEPPVLPNSKTASQKALEELIKIDNKFKGIHGFFVKKKLWI